MRNQCPVCGREFTGRSDKVFCGSTCKSRYHLGQLGSFPEKTGKLSPPVENHPLVCAVKRELASAGQLDSMLGATAISLAAAMCTPRVGNAAFVAASKELSRTMAEALKGAPVMGSKLTIARPVDELTTRRTKRQKRGYSRRP
jgi:hypothetical protein